MRRSARAAGSGWGWRDGGCGGSGRPVLAIVPPLGARRGRPDRAAGACRLAWVMAAPHGAWRLPSGIQAAPLSLPGGGGAPRHPGQRCGGAGPQATERTFHSTTVQSSEETEPRGGQGLEA